MCDYRSQNQLYFIANMGCEYSSHKQTVLISNSFFHLLQSGQIQQLLQKLKKEGKYFDYNTRCNFRGDTFLHYAASKNSLELVQYLLDQKADPNIQNQQGLRPIDLAHNKQILSLLEKKTTKKITGTKGKQSAKSRKIDAHEQEKKYIHLQNNKQKLHNESEILHSTLKHLSTEQSTNGHLAISDDQKYNQREVNGDRKGFRMREQKIVSLDRGQNQGY